MADKHAIVKLAIDICKNKVNTEFASVDRDEQMKVLREALIEANGGNTKINYKSLRRNVEIFEIIEEIVKLNDIQGFENNDFFEQFVEYKNLALGDQNSFHVEDNSLFIVNTTAQGISDTLRQRINVGRNVTIPTFLKTIEVYEEVNRLLAGRIDIVDFVDKIRRSFAEERMNAIYTTFVNSLASLPSQFIQAGPFVEDRMNEIVQHVESSTGGNAIIVGTKSALSNVASAVISDQARERYNQTGYYGVFNGTPMMAIKQSHVPGTFNFAISDKDLWVVANNTKPVKFVTEGDAIFEVGDVLKNADRTIEILVGETWGVGLVFNQYYGQYRLP